MSDVAVCPKCKVRMPVRTSKLVGGRNQVRYHECKCGYVAKNVVPAAYVFRRRVMA